MGGLGGLPPSRMKHFCRNRLKRNGLFLYMAEYFISEYKMEYSVISINMYELLVWIIICMNLNIKINSIRAEIYIYILAETSNFVGRKKNWTFRPKKLDVSANFFFGRNVQNFLAEKNLDVSASKIWPKRPFCFWPKRPNWPKRP